jgi:hypothetical protein
VPPPISPAEQLRLVLLSCFPPSIPSRRRAEAHARPGKPRPRTGVTA